MFRVLPVRGRVVERGGVNGVWFSSAGAPPAPRSAVGTSGTEGLAPRSGAPADGRAVVDLAARALLDALAADRQPAQRATARAVDDLVGRGLDVALGSHLVDADLAAADVDAVDRGVAGRVEGPVSIRLDERVRLTGP